MLKLKYIISIFFLFAVQQIYAASSNECPESFGDDYKIESSFEADNSFPGVFSDLPSGRIVVQSVFSETKCDPGFSKSKNVFTGLIFSVTKSNLEFFISQSSVFTRYSAVYIPIYLHTASFLL
jgi:hypothetical protein